NKYFLLPSQKKQLDAPSHDQKQHQLGLEYSQHYLQSLRPSLCPLRFMGTSKKNVAPCIFPGHLIPAFPPYAFTSSVTITSPIPIPLGLAVIPGANIFSAFSGSTPMPVSLTTTVILPFWSFSVSIRMRLTFF